MSKGRETFDRLLEEWGEETTHLSDVSKKYMNPSYQQIIGMGKKAVPFLLQELEKSPTHLFWALEAITGQNPVKEEHAGIMQEMANDWFEWARKKGYNTLAQQKKWDEVRKKYPTMTDEYISILVEKIKSFSELEEGWDTYDGSPISGTAIRRACDLLLFNDWNECVPCAVSPSPDGSILLSWSELEISVMPNGHSEFYIGEGCGAAYNMDLIKDIG